MEQKKPTSPFAKVQRRLPQFSVKSILLITLVFAVASSILVAAIRSPFVASEIALISGRPAPASSSGHKGQLLFLLLCYSSTMVLALVVQLVNRFNAWLQRQFLLREADENSKDPFGQD